MRKSTYTGSAVADGHAAYRSSPLLRGACGVQTGVPSLSPVSERIGSKPTLTLRIHAPSNGL